jgi:Fe-S-cluster-containing dehydrogenase component
MACKVEYDIKAGQGRRRRVIEKTVVETGTVRSFFISLACNQCENPACLAACPVSQPVGVGTASNSALWKDMTGASSGGVVGVVRVEPSKCIGCRRCEWACPYGAPQFNPDGINASGGRGVIHKCEMCWQRIANTALHPSRRVGACVATCLGQSIKQDWVNTDPTVAYSNTRKDTDDAGLGGLIGGSDVSGTQTYPAAQADFASPGTALSHFEGRGTNYVAEANMTRPGLKIRNRVYVTRNGSGVV